MRDPKARLQDILEAVAAIERYSNRTRSEFEQDELLQVWFLWHLQVIGEAARALPEHVRNLVPGIPWTKMIGMRNILVHGYFQIDPQIVWDTIHKDLPRLKLALQSLLKQLEDPKHGS